MELYAKIFVLKNRPCGHILRDPGHASRFPLACLGPKESLHHHLHASPIQGQRILQSTAKRKENTKKWFTFFDLLEKIVITQFL